MKAFKVSSNKVAVVMDSKVMDYIKARLECSSMKTYQDFRAETGAPHLSRANVCHAFKNALDNAGAAPVAEVSEIAVITPMSCGEKILVLENDHASYILHRLSCSSGDTFEHYRKTHSGVPSFSRYSFYSKFIKALENPIVGVTSIK